MQKDWKHSAKKKGKDDMDVDVAEEGEEDPLCKPCEGEDELDTLKGGGKGQPSNGYCNHCWKWGHKRSECRQLTAERAKGGKAETGGGKKGSDAQKGRYGNQKGGWQDKDGKGKGKSWGKGPKGFGGVAYNIDGDSSVENWNYYCAADPWSIIVFFMLQEDDESD